MSKKNLLNLRRGGALVMTALSAIFMLGMTALVTDVGFLYYSQSRLQTAVNAGWKAGYDRMLETLKSRYAPVAGSAEDTAIRNHVSEVMQKNGIATAGLKSFVISYTPIVARPYPGYYLRVEATQNVGLFFAKVINFATSDVYAVRENHPNDIGQGVVPLAIPHGAVIDETRNTFGFDAFEGGEGFNPGGEYILKLGSGGKKGASYVKPNKQDEFGFEEEELTTLLFIPMTSETLSISFVDQTSSATINVVSQTPAGLLKAYGAAYLCLKHAGNPLGNVPVYWLLGFNGGAFILHDTSTLRTWLSTAGVTYHVINDVDHENFLAAAPDYIELLTRPNIAVYSNKLPVTDRLNTEIAQTLTAAGIPQVSDLIVDDKTVVAKLDDTHVLFMDSEDMTGQCGGCSHYELTCEHFLRNGAFATANDQLSWEAVPVYNIMCPQCRFNYNPVTGSFTADAASKCSLKDKRCSERQHEYLSDKKGLQILTWGEISNSTKVPKFTSLVCGTSTRSLCYDFIMQAKANNLIAPLARDLFQQTKLNVAYAIKDHLHDGGYLFAKGFAAETIDLALWLKNGNYSDSIAFTKMTTVDFPVRRSYVQYSTINCASDSAQQTFTLSYRVAAPPSPPDPRCQNHEDALSTGISETNAFNNYDAGAVVLGTNSNAKYIKGSSDGGEYCYLAGNIVATSARRLVLNNLLYAAGSKKGVTSNFSIARQKGNYGPLDPDNEVAGGASDYREWFMTGFDQPLQLWDRVIKENGNMRGPTDQAVDFRIDNNNRFVIIPITDVPPEVKAVQGSDIDTIYALQGNNNPNPDGQYTPDVASFTSAVRIIGFAMFELIDLKDAKDTTIGGTQAGQVRGKFVKYIVDPREVAGMDPYVTTP